MTDHAKAQAQHLEAEKNEASTLALHEQAMQETTEPFEEMVHGPLWFYLLVVASLVIGAFYLGRHMGSLDTAAHIGFLNAGGKTGQVADAGAPGAAPAAPHVDGAAIYTSRCVSCHQANGMGIPGAFPPLVGSEYVLGKPEVLVRILLHGLQGEIKVAGNTFNGVMPPWAEQLSDEEIAGVASHVRSGMGDNKADKVDAALVKKIREETKDRTTPFTAQDLEAAS
ncbi:c-type cytochrome [Methylobacillus glycogenes]|uniref:c-type cytochrome n=1 Tax=Methylobacillus glycogenes TaxID=406 RepID=UPI000471DC25|nr:cytochrome c [Methylobacillus glycogenes]